MLIGKILTSIRCKKRVLDLSSPVVAGILNITPDSFFGPRFKGSSPGEITDFAGNMLSDGASIIDVGGMSSRPGAEEIGPGEEKDRVLPAIEAIIHAFPDALISIDTYRSNVADEALKAGACIVNDISGGDQDPDMYKVVRSHQSAYMMMHMRGKPVDMQQYTDYDDVISSILKYFINKIRDLRPLGINDVILDPGFGFAKTMEQNYRIIQNLNVFRSLGFPVMIGVSRKSTLSKTIGGTASDTLAATTALHLACLQNGASILRVHDIKPAVDTIAVFHKLREAKNH